VRIALGSDDEAAVLAAIEGLLGDAGHVVVGRFVGIAWPDAGRAVGELVARGIADVGVVCCWTGTGVSIAANKIPGVRAALCGDAATAAGARRWNDANVLALSLRLTTDALAEEILGAFLETDADKAERELIERIEELRDAPGPHAGGQGSTGAVRETTRPRELGLAAGRLGGPTV
jgi:ribose 5-phosphate isomerase B